MEKRIEFLLVVLLGWAVLASSFAASLYMENLSLKKRVSAIESETIFVDIGVDYGNGTVTWFNNTILPKGSTALSALVSIARVEYRIGDYGAYVLSVNGIWERKISNNEGFSWMWYYYDPEEGLKMGPVAADKYVLSDGDIIVWRYEHWKF